MKTGEINFNDDAFHQLNKPRSKEPDLGIFNLDKKFEQQKNDLQHIKESGKSLTQKYKAILAENDLTDCQGNTNKHGR